MTWPWPPKTHGILWLVVHPFVDSSGMSKFGLSVTSLCLIRMVCKLSKAQGCSVLGETLDNENPRIPAAAISCLLNLLTYSKYKTVCRCGFDDVKCLSLIKLDLTSNSTGLKLLFVHLAGRTPVACKIADLNSVFGQRTIRLSFAF